MSALAIWFSLAWLIVNRYGAPSRGELGDYLSFIGLYGGALIGLISFISLLMFSCTGLYYLVKSQRENAK